MRKALDAYSDISSNGDTNSPFYHHTTLSRTRSLFLEKGWDFEGYFKFTTLRNPWDMIVSLYFFAKTDLNGIEFWRNSPAHQPERLMPFKQWILTGKPGRFYSLQNFVCDQNGKNLADHVVKIETMEKDAAYIEDRLGLKLDIAVSNRTKHKHYSEYYDRETAEIIRSRFAHDIEFGKYEFAPK
jgi:hypothetical protein